MLIDVKEYVQVHKDKLRGQEKSLAIIQVGDNPASNSYVKGKLKDLEDVGMAGTLFKFSGNEPDLVNTICAIIGYAATFYDGIMVQLPIPNVTEDEVTDILNTIPLEKDVDGLNEYSIFTPCTPLGVYEIIKYQERKGLTTGKNVVIINRSNLVGRPLAKLLLDNDYTVTVCHSQTAPNTLYNLLSSADIIVTAVGQPNFINGEFTLKRGATIIDVGISRVFDEDLKAKLVGDVDPALYDRPNLWITPVPGGMGLMTRLSLLKNLAKA